MDTIPDLVRNFTADLQRIIGGEWAIKRYLPAVYRVRGEQSSLEILFYLSGAARTDGHFIHIDEDVWIKQPDKLLTRLKVRSGSGRKIHARHTVVARIDKKQAMAFQDAHHLQAPLPGKFRYGLFLQGELVSVAVFSGGRKMWGKPDTYRSYELLRFCHKGEILVVGGLSKLIRQFENDHRPGDLMTYSDRDWSDGRPLMQLGFEVRKTTEPQEFWIEKGTGHRYTERDLPESVASLSPDRRRDVDRLDELGFHRIRNRGSLKLVKSFSPDPIVILGPTASGKTRLAIDLAKRIGGAIISADSRQVYRGLDIGTGKDLEEYENIPYFLIDIVDAGEQYHVANFLADARNALQKIQQLGLVPIICGGTGLYIQGLLQGYPYSNIPTNESLREDLARYSLNDLREKLAGMQIPTDFQPDTSTAKRLIRAIEIASWLVRNPGYKSHPPICPEARVYGIGPERTDRRAAISKRLRQRLEHGLLDEVQELMDRGLTPEQLIYYGLEYKYCTLYLTGQLEYDEFLIRLETAIHRFAKRQMTYFRKMEKDGITIHWLKSPSSDVFWIYRA